MMAFANQSPLSSIDWLQPWYASVRVRGSAIAAGSDWRAALNLAAASEQLCNHRQLPLRFVAQTALPPATAYESFISATGSVPTRDNLHDFFNALVWLAFPRLKAQLNALQASEIDRTGTKARNRVRDAATLFDENAALVVLRDSAEGRALAQALRSHQWDELFLGQRARFEADCRVTLFGHALMEKLTAPYKAITAHAWLLLADDAYFALPPAAQHAWLDARVTRQLMATGSDLVPSAFTPLPVLGVPGWSALQDAAFYADATVFRPPRVRSR